MIKWILVLLSSLGNTWLLALALGNQAIAQSSHEECTPAINIATLPGAIVIRSDNAIRAIYELWKREGLADPGDVVVIIIAPVGDGLVDVHPVVDGLVCEGLIMPLRTWNIAENGGVNI
jgi:hypothetical protein